MMEEKKFDLFKNVSFKHDGCLSIHIKDSYLVTDETAMRRILQRIHESIGYSSLQDAGYTRTFASALREWKAHNFLYKIGYKRERTGSVDINQNEPLWRRICYAVLSLFA